MEPRDSGRSPRERLHDLLISLRRAILRRRRLLAALCAAGAVVTALRAVAPPPPPSAEVVVAAHDLAAGAPVGADDVSVRTVPPDVVPAGALTRTDQAVGVTLASPLRAGEAVTDVRLVGAALTDAAAGAVAVPVRLSDAAQAALLRVGDRIDLLATDPQARETRTIATAAVVLATPSVDADATDTLTGRLVVLGIAESEVREVTASTVTAFVTYTWANR